MGMEQCQWRGVGIGSQENGILDKEPSARLAVIVNWH